MRGYLGEPDLTRDVLRDGWYVTGDIATIDESGFIRITDRLSRSDLPKLWIPKREDLHIVESIPTLGTGKVDLRAVRQVAAERSA